MKWTYNHYRATLQKNGAAFAIVTPDGKNALSELAAAELIGDLNRGESPVMRGLADFGRSTLHLDPHLKGNEGWRTIMPGEILQDGDEFWDAVVEKWHPVTTMIGAKCLDNASFRRKFQIGPTVATSIDSVPKVTEPLSGWGDVDFLGGGTAPGEKDPELGGDS